jgi:hypothetical protein
MARFRIVRVDPFEYKEEILALWRDNLPGTPPGRFEWMGENPDGPTVWYLAFDEKADTVAGSISIMPRAVKFHGVKRLSGIAGDFMVKKEYRAFGPALGLMKTIIRDYSNLGFAFLYTVPNDGAERMALRAGFEKAGYAGRLVKALNYGNSLRSRMPPAVARLIAPCINVGLKAISKDTYVRSEGEITETGDGDTLLGLSSADIESKWLIAGERNQDYIKWKFFQNPLYASRMFTYRTHAGDLLGYIVFHRENRLVHIFDMFFKNSRALDLILSRFLRDMRKGGCESVSIRIFEETSLYKIFRSYGFLAREGGFPLLFAGKMKVAPEKWLFFSGDRNL